MSRRSPVSTASSPSQRSAPAPARRRRWSGWPTIAVGVVAAVLVTLAVVDPGLPTVDPRLHDGSVYVTNASLERVGKFNRQIDELSGSAALSGKGGDVLQDGNDVATIDHDTGQLSVLDPGSLGLGAAALVPNGASVGLQAGRVAISDPTTGAMWVRPLAEAAGIEFTRTTPDIDLGLGGFSALGVDGTAYGVSVERGELVTVTPEGTAVTKLETAPSANSELTVVGTTPVLLDRDRGEIRLLDRDVTITVPQAKLAELQAPSERVPEVAGSSIEAVLATPEGLFGIAESGLVELGRAPGTPATPVVVAGCAYGAFSGGATTEVVTRCDRTAAATAEATGWTAPNEVVFRVNRDEVVLNDVVGGDVWLVTEDMRLIEGWDKVTPPAPDENGEVTNEEITREINPNRSLENRPPIAEGDRLTVRAGRATLLTVTDNDSDPDGDVLTFTGVPELPESRGTLGLVRGGTGLQVTVPEDATGSFTISYEISDGRGGTATATATVAVVSADQQVTNNAPVQVPQPRSLAVSSGGDAEARVLLDWRDPEGDDLTLVGATVEGDDEVSVTPEGMLTFRDAGTELGRKEVTVVVSDGVAETKAVLSVQAVQQAVPPLAFGDHVTARTGEEITVKPLLNDIGDNLILSKIDEAPEGARAQLADAESFTFSAQKAGTYYFTYVVSNGPRSYGVVRIDVTDSPDENKPPVAARDQAPLPAGGSVLIDPLANDEDPDEDVLVVQQVTTDPRVRVRILRRHQVEITALRTLGEPLVLGYTVSDGQHAAQGSIVVLPRKPDTQQPRAIGDSLVVRAGDTGEVRVLANDLSPSGLELTLDEKLSELPAAGQAWVTDELVRFRAPTVPGEYRAVYQVRDSQGRTASAQVRFQVVDDAVPNTAPKAPEVVERVLADSTSRIVIPLRGLDPEGDSVRLLGVDVPPTLGRIVSIGDGEFGYEAYADSAGTDEFTYRIVDARGAVAIGTIRLGVVPRAAGNTPPVAVEDVVTARPNQVLRIPVLANDSDPDGDSIGFASEPVGGLPGAKVVDDRVIEVKVPAVPGTMVGTYTIIDSRGAEASGTIRITGDPTAPLQAPTLVDDVVPAWDVLDSDVITVPVLDNDDDPDGNIKHAMVSIPPDGVPEEERPTVEDNQVKVKVTERMQVIRYQVTDTDGLIAFATVTVPGLGDAVPALRPDIPVQEVVAGEEKEFQIADFVQGRGGRAVRLTDDERIWATHGTATATGTGSVSFVAPVEYSGPASMTFEVTDGANATDPDGRTAVLTVPIKVLPAPQTPEGREMEPENQPPTAVPVTLTVAAGEEGRSLDLRPAVRDPDGDPLTFREPTFAAPAGLTVRLEGSRLSAEATPQVPAGTRVEGTVTAGDGEHTVPVQVTVEVTATTRPAPQAIDDVVPDAVQGRTTTVAVLGNDVNPFPDDPLTLRNAVVETGVGEAAVDGDRVVVTPGADFVGTLVVRYTIRDVTDVPERESEGRIRLTVQGRPDQPGTPRRVQVSNRQAVINWTAPEANGSPITGYTVTATGGGATTTQACTTTTCTITDLTNDVGYTFTVVATNAHGDSEPSSPSAVITPDVRPEAPTSASAKFGDKQLQLSWAEARTEGSAVQEYEIELSGPNGLERRTVGAVTSYTWSGLTNGSAYTFRVRARNKAPEPSDFSPRSQPETPAGKPSAPSLISAEDSAARTGRQLKLTWDPPANTNGAPITKYLITANSSTTEYVPKPGQTSRITHTMQVPSNTTYTVRIKAQNKAGVSAASRAIKVVVYSAPPAPRSVTLAAEPNERLQMGYRPGADDGQSTPTYQYSLNKGAARAYPSGGVVKGTAGQTYTVRIRACRSDGAGNKCSAWTASPAQGVVAYKPPARPSMGQPTGSGIRRTFSWSSPSTSNGRKVTLLQIRVNGGSWQSKPLNDTITLGDGPSQTHKVEVRVRNSEGDYSAVNSRSAKTSAASAYTDDGPLLNPQPDTCPLKRCYEAYADVKNFPPNTTVTCTTHFGNRSASGRTDNNGNTRFYVVGLGQNITYRMDCVGGGVSVTSPERTDWPT
ncbi:Ig-like domain-containing protein [Propionibacteriaceae bacterium Y2011]